MARTKNSRRRQSSTKTRKSVVDKKSEEEVLYGRCCWCNKKQELGYKDQKRVKSN